MSFEFPDLGLTLVDTKEAVRVDYKAQLSCIMGIVGSSISEGY